MTPIKRTLLATTFAVAAASVATVAFALPGLTACVLVGMADLRAVDDGTLTDSESEADHLRYIQPRDARARIEATFGAAPAPKERRIFLRGSRRMKANPFIDGMPNVNDFFRVVRTTAISLKR